MKITYRAMKGTDVVWELHDDVPDFSYEELIRTEEKRMTAQQAIKIIETERKCVERSDTCDRDCGKCDLVMEQGEILEAYDLALRMLLMEGIVQKARVKAGTWDEEYIKGWRDCCDYILSKVTDEN